LPSPENVKKSGWQLVLLAMHGLVYCRRCIVGDTQRGLASANAAINVMPIKHETM